MKDIDYAIDFGTSTTLLAIPRPDKALPIKIELDSANVWLPSVISSNDGISWETGSNALFAPVAQKILSPKTAITANLDFLENSAGVRINADEAIGLILERVMATVKQNNLNPDGVVRMSCPAMWNGAQRQRLIKIARKIGFNTNIDDLMDEPIAAGINWWWNKTLNSGTRIDSSKILVFDLGGGTLDVAVLYINSFDNQPPEITVMGARGTNLAGDEIDRLFAEYILKRMHDENDFDYLKQQRSAEVYGIVLREAREAKERLSSIFSTKLTSNYEGFAIPQLEITRQDFEENVISKIIGKLKIEVELVLREVRLKKDDLTAAEAKRIPLSEISSQIDHVVFAGGMSQVPKITSEIMSMFDEKTQLDYTTLNKSDSALGIVEGLASRNESLNLNVHRPNFSFVINYAVNGKKVEPFILYPAFEPIYNATDVFMEKAYLSFSNSFVPSAEPDKSTVYLSLETLGGRKLTLFNVEDDSETSAIALSANRLRGLRFTLYIDGKFVIQDALGSIMTARVRQWPFIRWGVNTLMRPSVRIESDFSSRFINSSMDDWRTSH